MIFSEETEDKRSVQSLRSFEREEWEAINSRLANYNNDDPRRREFHRICIGSLFIVVAWYLRRGTFFTCILDVSVMSV